MKPVVIPDETNSHPRIVFTDESNIMPDETNSHPRIVIPE